MIDRFFRFVKRHPGALAGATVSSVGGIIGAVLSFDSLVHRLAEYYAGGRTDLNIKEVDTHNKEHPDDLWGYEHYSIEDTMGDAQAVAVVVWALAIIIAVVVSSSIGDCFDPDNRPVAQPPLGSTPPVVGVVAPGTP